MRHFFENDPDQFTPEQLNREIDNAKSQEQKLLAVFKRDPKTMWTREELEDTCVLQAPTASYVRAVSTLEDQGFIKKVVRKNGKFGKPVWRYIYDA